MAETPLNNTAALAAIAALAMLAWPGASARAAQTLTVIEHATTNATPVHGGKAPDNVGDILTFNNPIFDAANKAQIGGDQGFCVRLVVGKTFECHWTLKVPDGQLMVDGPFNDDGDTILAVTGGTGSYDGATGEMLLHARDAKGTEYDFVYRLK